MNTVMMMDAIPARGMAFDGAFGWLLFAFAAFSIGMLVATTIASLRQRTALRSVHCPRYGVRAHVAVRLAGASGTPTVRRCSLLSPRTSIACGGGCVAGTGFARSAPG